MPGALPVHIHSVVQPVTAAQIQSFGIHGPRLQVEMFGRGEPPTTTDVVEACERPRESSVRSNPQLAAISVDVHERP